MNIKFYNEGLFFKQFKIYKARAEIVSIPPSQLASRQDETYSLKRHAMNGNASDWLFRIDSEQGIK